MVDDLIFTNTHNLDELFENNFKNKIHIKYQQRNGRKGITLIEGLEKYIERPILKKIIKSWKKQLATNASVKYDDDNMIILLQGDKRNDISTYLVNNEICNKENIKMHGY